MKAKNTTCQSCLRFGLNNKLAQTLRFYFIIGFALISWVLGVTAQASGSGSIDEDNITVNQIRDKVQLSEDTLTEAPEVALRLVLEATEMLENVDDSLLLAKVYYLKAKIQSNMGNYAAAIPDFEKSLLIYSKLQELNGYADAANHLGVIYDHLGDYDEALRHYFMSINALDESNPKGLVYAYNNIALIYMAEQVFDKARANLIKSVEIAKAHDLSESLTYPYHNLGDLHDVQQAYDSALYYYRQSYIIDSLNQDKIGIGINLKAMAEVYKELGEIEKARSHLQEALGYLLPSDDQLNLSSTYSSLGEVLLLDGQYDPAIMHAEMGLQLAQDINAKPEIQQAADVLSKIYKAMDNFEKALTFTEISHIYQDSLFNETKSREMALLQLRQAESEKELLRVDNELQIAQMDDQQLLIERQTYIVILVTFGLIISVIFLVILNHANRDKKTTNKQLVLQQQEIENIIAELKILNQHTEGQRNKLEASNQIKDKLISIISHDFRSPLNSLEGVLQLFSDGHISESEMKLFAHDLRLKVHFTTNLLDNLLNWAKNQMQGISPGPEPFDTYKLSEETIHLVALQAENKGVKIVNEILVDRHTQIFADYEMIKLVLRNLLSNAIKFTNRGGEVRIKAVEQDGFILLFVKDSGVGMKEEQLDHLFTDQTSSTPGTSHEKGTGLGLMLCKDFVEKNGGRIYAQSLEGDGSTFSFTVPVYEPSEQPGAKKNNKLKQVY